MAINDVKLKLNAGYPTTPLSENPDIYHKFLTPKYYFYNLKLS